jgi:cytochrome c
MISLPRIRALSAASALVATALASPALADAAAGAALFKTTCALCHTTAGTTVKIGPPLFKVVGRKAGTVPGFQYSAAMKKAGWVWSEAKLATYIDSPMKTLPGNRMPFFGVHDVAKAQSIAAYLGTLK